MTDITNPLHSRADVDLVDRLRAAVAMSRGLAPSDYRHFVALTNKRPDRVQPIEPLRDIPSHNN